MRVFIGALGATLAATPITDPHYAGSLAFFLDSGAHAGMSTESATLHGAMALRNMIAEV